MFNPIRWILFFIEVIDFLDETMADQRLAKRRHATRRFQRGNNAGKRIF